jgi:hypothetical protein
VFFVIEKKRERKKNASSYIVFPPLFLEFSSFTRLLFGILLLKKNNSSDGILIFWMSCLSEKWGFLFIEQVQVKKNSFLPLLVYLVSFTGSGISKSLNMHTLL